jgi:NAD(P)-dependent dehydrogenase (short-subunit alcohol dehydrogenase family)
MDLCEEDPNAAEGQNAAIYGGGGAIGGAVARAFRREGAMVHLAGRTLAPLQVVAAVEALCKQLASELGQHGIRVVSILTGA